MSVSSRVLLKTGMLALQSRAVMLASDSADGNSSDIEKRMEDLELDLTEEGSSSNVVDKDDDLETVQHIYFEEEVTGGTNDGASSVDISDNISEASSCPPVCKNLPSGKNFDPRKKNEFSDTASYQSTLLTRVSHYDQKDPKFDPKKAMGDDLNQLMSACRSGDRGVVKRLRENVNVSIDINQVSGDYGEDGWGHKTGEFRPDDTVTQKRFGVFQEGGFTPLTLACQQGHASVVQEILSFNGIDVNRANNKQMTALYLACQEGHTSVVRVLLERNEIEVNKAAYNGRTPLSEACFEGHLEIVEKLLQRNEIEVNKANKYDSTPLYVACLEGHLEIVKKLLERNEIEVNKADKHDRAPLYIACLKGHLEIVEKLLERKEIKVNQKIMSSASGEIADVLRKHSTNKCVIS